MSNTDAPQWEPCTIVSDRHHTKTVIADNGSRYYFNDFEPGYPDAPVGTRGYVARIHAPMGDYNSFRPQADRQAAGNAAIPPSTLRAYTVFSGDEETECENCGAPITIGETVYYASDADLDVYCCPGCAAIDRKIKAGIVRNG